MATTDATSTSTPPALPPTKTDAIPFNHSLINGSLIFPPFLSQARVDQIKDFQVRPTDVFITTYPKVGTTWTQRIVHLIINNGDVSHDPRNLSDAIPWFESKAQDEMAALPDPRIYKSHSQWSVIARNDAAPCKYIYVARNPKDTCVSLFHHMRAIQSFDYTGEWDEFVELFLKGVVESGSWFDHVRPWWEHRDDGNILFLKYEDMKLDLASAVQRISEFIGCGTLSESVLDRVVQQSSFEAMKADPKSNYEFKANSRRAGETPFMRKGVVGDWQQYFSDDQARRLDELYEKEFGGNGLTFDSSLSS